MNLSYSELEILKNFIQFRDFEVCGTLVYIKGVVKPFIQAVGKSIDGRNACIIPNEDRYIFHTHASTMKGYPSPEDILKVVKKKNPIKTSIVLTMWGIWEISCIKKVNITKDMKNYLVNVIKQDSLGMYHVTEKGRKLSRQVLPVVESFMNSVIHNVNRKIPVGLTMLFTPWNFIGKYGYNVKFS